MWPWDHDAWWSCYYESQSCSLQDKYTLLLVREEVEMVGAHWIVPSNLISNIHQSMRRWRSSHGNWLKCNKCDCAVGCMFIWEGILNEILESHWKVFRASSTIFFLLSVNCVLFDVLKFLLLQFWWFSCFNLSWKIALSFISWKNCATHSGSESF